MGEAEVLEIVLYGQGRMDAMGRVMTDQELADLVAFLFDEWGSGAAAID